MNSEAANAGSLSYESDQGSLRKVTAIVRTSVLERVEQQLKALHVPGISVARVKGYGEYANFFTRDWMCPHARIEIYCRQERADEIARCIMRSAHSGRPGDGLVAVVPVESLYRIRSGERARSDELGGCECRDPQHMPARGGGEW